MKKIIFAVAASLIALVSHAQGDPEAISVLNKLKEKYPATSFSSIERTQVAGMYEVTMGKNIAYTDKDGRYFLFGNLYDMQTQQDLSSAKRQSLSRIDWNQMPLKDAIVTVKGNGKRKVAVFSDPDCPFCRKLEPELAKLNDVTIYTFMYPIDSLHPQARRKSESIWCAKDKSMQWTKAMVENAAVPAANCDNPVSRNIALAEKLGIRGTPYLIAEDGRSFPGMAAADRLDTFLNGAQQ